MPVAVTYPGVYIEELESGPQAIIGVATSIAAFVGRAPIGPTHLPVTLFNYADYKDFFGGLEADYPLSYAVRDFFDNGGTEAIVARLFEPAEGQGDGIARLSFPAPTQGEDLSLVAANPGMWGNRLTAAVDRKGITDATAERLTADHGLEAEDLFNLTLTLETEAGQIVATERFLNLSVKTTGKSDGPYPNRIDRCLATSSNLARLSGILPATPPQAGSSATGAGGNDGAHLSTSTYLGDQNEKTGIYLLDHATLFNLLCIPPDRLYSSGLPEVDLDPAVRLAAARYCADRRAFYIVDPPSAWAGKAANGEISQISPEDVGIAGRNGAGVEIARNAAVYFPRFRREESTTDGEPALYAPCGAVAGVIAATDIARGVWKAPAGTEAGLAGVLGFEVNLTDGDVGELNPLGINCLRTLPIFGPVVWGARTLRGADAFQDDYKYVPVRRLILFIEESLYRGTQWAVFEPNDEALWSALRLQVGSFLAGLARQGAFYDYHVACDATTTTQADIDNGIVNVLVQIAPVKPAEFVVLQIQQVAGGTPG